MLEQISLENRETAERHFPPTVISKANLSKGTQRTFDNLIKVFQRTQTGPRADFVSEIEVAANSAALETEYNELKAKAINMKVDKIW